MRGSRNRRNRLSTNRARVSFETLEDRCLLAAVDVLAWQPLEPQGSLVYQTEASGSIVGAQQRDEYTLETDAGQSVAIILSPSPALRPTIELLTADDQLLASSTAEFAGGLIRLSATLPSEPGPYRLVATEADGTTGDYQLQIFTGTVLETELPGATDNDTAASAEDLDTLFRDLGESGAARVAVTGEGGDDWFRFSLADGQLASFALGSEDAENTRFEIYDSQELLLAVSALENGSFHIVRNLADATANGSDDEYLVRIAPNSGSYSLVVLRDASFEMDPNGGVPAGAHALGNDIELLGHVTPWTQPWREAELLLPVVTDKEDFTGQTVATDGQRMLVGSPGKNDAAGSASVYRLDEGRWKLEQELVAPDAGRSDAFGASVAIEGDVVVIGADKEDEAGTSAGSAYVYRFDGSQWVFEAKLLADDGEDEDQFGAAVAVGGNSIFVGAPVDKDRLIGIKVGAVYRFEFDGTDWLQAEKMLANVPAQNDMFGTSLALHDDTLLVGAVEEKGTVGNGDSASVFRRNGDVWEFEQLLNSASQGRDAQFGQAVSLTGNVAIIGAPKQDGADRESGAAFVFRFDGTQWNEEQMLLGDNSAEGDRFGASVAITDDRAIVGSPQHDARFNDSGSAYLYAFDGTAWELQQQLAPLDTAPNMLFGTSVAITADMLATGAVGRELPSRTVPGEIDASVGGLYIFTATGFAANSSSPVADEGLTQSAVDLYSFQAAVGDSLAISASAQITGAGEQINRLAPLLELFDSAGRLLARSSPSVDAGGNAIVEFDVVEAGEYFVRLWADGDAGGEYLLTIAGATGGDVPFGLELANSFPAPGSSVQSANQILISFAQPLLLPSLSADDLRVDGQAAVGLQVVDGKTILFELADNLEDGSRIVEFAPAALTNVAGIDNGELQYEFFVDSVAPRIIATSLQPDFTLGTGVLDFTLTLAEANQFVKFDDLNRPVFAPSFAVVRSGLRLVGQNTGSYAVRSLALTSIDAEQATLRITFRDLQVDDYTLTIVGGPEGIFDLAGNLLDGEVDSLPIPPGGSGDGVPGGDFVYSFAVAADAPIVSIPDVAGTPGEIVTAKILLENLNNVSAFDFDLQFDPNLLTVDRIRLGAEATNWTLAARVDDIAGTIAGSLFNFLLVTGDGGEFLEIDFQIAENAAIETVLPLNLARVSINEAGVPTEVNQGTLTVRMPSFRVVSAAAGAAVIDLELDKAVDPSTLRLYGASPTTEATATLVDDADNSVPGSLIWNAEQNRLSFVPTGRPLVGGTYQLTIPGGDLGPVGIEGEGFDGDGDGWAGGDYALEVVVEDLEARTILIPDFTVGPQQSLVRAGTPGVPIRIDDGSGVTKIEFSIAFNSELLQFDGANIAAGLPADWSVSQFSQPADGMLQVTVEGTTPLGPGAHDLALLSANVPAAANAGSAHALRVGDVNVNDGELFARGDVGVHLAAYIGDATGDGAYSSMDAALIARVAVGRDSGFDSFPLIDPLLVADVTGDGTSSSYDASLVARAAAGMQSPIPDLPTPAAWNGLLTSEKTLAAQPPPPPQALIQQVNTYLIVILEDSPSVSQSPLSRSINPLTPMQSNLATAQSPVELELKRDRLFNTTRAHQFSARRSRDTKAQETTAENDWNESVDAALRSDTWNRAGE